MGDENAQPKIENIVEYRVEKDDKIYIFTRLNFIYEELKKLTCPFAEDSVITAVSRRVDEKGMVTEKVLFKSRLSQY